MQSCFLVADACLTIGSMLAIERIFDLQVCYPRRPPARAPTMHSRVRMPHPGADLDGKDAVDMENGRNTEEEMRTNVEYLVLGHFKRKEGNAKQRHAHHAVVGAR